MEKSVMIHVERKQGNVNVCILLDRKNNKYRFCNFTHPHICPCEFDSIEDAIKDLEKEKNNKKIINYTIWN